MSGYAKRLVGVSIVAVAFAVGIVLYLVLYLTAAQPSIAATQTSAGKHLYLATVPAAELTDPHPTWVSYYSVNSQSQDWKHRTTYVLPAHSVVHVTIFEYDTQTGLRNNFIGQSTGTIGGHFLLDGKPVTGINPNTASHVFAIPQIGLSVPLMGPGANAKNLCANAPCSLSNAHEAISFEFRTPAKGLYRWQCFVPCAAGYIAGFGGPMQTVGYMGGFIKVV
jgi:hypothetical protein